MTKLERNEMLNKQKKDREFWDDVFKPTSPRGYEFLFPSLELWNEWYKVITGLNYEKEKK